MNGQNNDNMNDTYDNNNDFNDILGDEDSDNSRLLKVQLYDTKGSYTILEAYPGTKACDILDAIVNKIDLTPDESTYYTLILVHSRLYQGTVTPLARYHCLKTLRSDDDVWEALNRVVCKQTSKYDKLEGYPASKVYNRWFFKDIRSKPVDVGDDVSGNSSSDDEESISLSEMSYLRQGERRGYLLRRSNRDPNLWRKRYCVLTDKLWCMDVKRLHPRSRCIRINGSTIVSDRTPSLDYPNCVVMHDQGTTNFFRAISATEQQQWYDDIHQRCNLAKENDVITMAEMIMSDEEMTRGHRYTRGIAQLINSKEMISMLMDYKSMDCPHNNDNNEQQLNIYSFSSASKECLNRRVHRHRRNMIHSLHDNDNDENDYNNTFIFKSLAFVTMIQKYKELHRHDLLVTAKEQWFAALGVYKQFLLPYLLSLGHLTADSIIEDIIFDINDINNNSSNDENSQSNCHNNDGLHWKVSFDSLALVHNEIFSNIKRKDDTSNSNVNDIVNDNKSLKCDNNNDSSNGFWSWTKAFSSAETVIEVYEKKVVSNSHTDQILMKYDIIDSNRLPSSTLFDNIVKEIEASFTYTKSNNQDAFIDLLNQDSLDEYCSQSGIQSTRISSDGEDVF